MLFTCLVFRMYNRTASYALFIRSFAIGFNMAKSEVAITLGNLRVVYFYWIYTTFMILASLGKNLPLIVIWIVLVGMTSVLSVSLLYFLSA